MAAAQEDGAVPISLQAPPLHPHGGTEGSISVERVAKPLKNKVLTKERNRLGTGRAELLLRAGLNLNFIRAAKQDLKIA